MSRVGKMPIAVPQGVDVAITAEQITVKGRLGTLVRPVNSLVTIKNDGLASCCFCLPTNRPRPMR
jgi:large subunit ribosomal protein L6